MKERISRALSPLRCTACKAAIGLTERFERRDGRNYHFGCVPAGGTMGGAR